LLARRSRRIKYLLPAAPQGLARSTTSTRATRTPWWRGPSTARPRCSGASTSSAPASAPATTAGRRATSYRSSKWGS